MKTLGIISYADFVSDKAKFVSVISMTVMLYSYCVFKNTIRAF